VIESTYDCLFFKIMGMVQSSAMNNAPAMHATRHRGFLRLVTNATSVFDRKESHIKTTVSATFAMTIHASNVFIWSLKLKPTPFPWSKSINTSRNIETTGRTTQQSDQVDEVQTVFLLSSMGSGRR
jgi:acetolactate synthase regulatory subunit